MLMFKMADSEGYNYDITITDSFKSSLHVELTTMPTAITKQQYSQ